MTATPHDNDELSPTGQRWLARPTTGDPAAIMVRTRHHARMGSPER